MRQVINFNYEWLYCPKDLKDGYEKECNENEFTLVSLPYANTILDKHKGENGDFPSQIEKYRFISCYRKHFTLHKDMKDKRIVLNFGAVATVAEVFVNGIKAGEHKGAYTSFDVDITKFLTFGEDNVISVRVDSTKHSDIPPEGGNVDYCLFGGIVRGVTMTVTEKEYIKSVFAYTQKSDKDSAEVVLQCEVEGEGKITAELFDSDGKLVSKGESRLEVDKPNLWGIENPYLYTLRVKFKEDVYEEKIGIRTFKFVNAGIELNGEVIKICGINRHEQWPWIGRAVPDKLQARDADMVKETGFNAVRCSHYPQSPAFLSRCDEIGLIVFEEAPGWQHIGDGFWQDIYKENIREMIKRDCNHPSIFSWGVRVNESNDCDSLYEETNRLARELDPTRPTHGTRRQDSYEGSNFLEDIYTAHYIYPDNPKHKPFIVTEHSWDCWGNGYGLPGASDEEALGFAKDFADKVNYYYGNENCAGGFAWSMFDYDNEVNYTKTENVFYSGIYDIFRLPKMVSNVYISQKDPKNAGANIYIANYWDDDQKPIIVRGVSGDIAQGEEAKGEILQGASFSVTVMSNCERVELYINGKKVAKEPVRQYTNLPHPFFVFEDIEYAPGEVTAVGYIGDEERARYTQRTPGKAHHLTLTPDYDTLVCDGADMTQVTVCVADESETRLPRGDNRVKISLSGEGEFIGEEEIALEGGRCVFIVKSKYKKAGDIICRVTGEGLIGAECVIKSEGEWK